MPVPLSRTSALGEVTAALVYGKRVKEASEAIAGLFKEAKIEKIPVSALVYVIAAAMQGSATPDAELMQAVAEIAARFIAPGMGQVIPADVASVHAKEILQEIAKTKPALAAHLPDVGAVQALAKDPQFQPYLQQAMRTDTVPAEANKYIEDVRRRGIWPQQRQPAGV